MDFTIEAYKRLIESLLATGYSFQTFEEFIKLPKDKVVVLRHDVDLLPKNSLLFAKIQNDFGIRGTYYFRAVPESWDEDIIAEISKLGHEIGYHYENLTSCKGDMELAVKDFELNLKRLRRIANVETICMHGSPKSKYDSKDLWKDHDYENFGIIGEPYFDVNFDDVFYLTDTGRMWDGFKYSVRDKVNSGYQEEYHSTHQIIEAIEKNELPLQIMFTFHPQRWHDFGVLWMKELVLQNMKNIVKRFIYVKN